MGGRLSPEGFGNALGGLDMGERHRATYKGDGPSVDLVDQQGAFNVVTSSEPVGGRSMLDPRHQFQIEFCVP
jgi:hypothetical protein